MGPCLVGFFDLPDCSLIFRSAAVTLANIVPNFSGLGLSFTRVIIFSLVPSGLPPWDSALTSIEKGILAGHSNRGGISILCFFSRRNSSVSFNACIYPCCIPATFLLSLWAPLAKSIQYFTFDKWAFSVCLSSSRIFGIMGFNNSPSVFPLMGSTSF